MSGYFSKLTAENFYDFAVKHYNRFEYVDKEEFEEDILRFKYIKKLLKRYETSGELKHRLILNHIIILSNVFGILPTLRMLFFKIEEKHHPEIKTLCSFLNYLSYFNNQYILKHDNINIDRIPENNQLVHILRTNG